MRDLIQLEFRPITTDDIAAMAALLLDRQRLECQTYPYLNNSCLQTEYIIDRLQRLFANVRVVGIGAFSKRHLVGYLIGSIRIDTRNGRFVAIPYEGVAVRADVSAELIRYLYAQTAGLWLEHGCFCHSGIVPIGHHTYFDAFLRLSFGIEQVYAVLSLDDYEPFDNLPEASVRLATLDDKAVMGEMSGIISRHQNGAPAFIPTYPEVLTSIREGFEQSLEDEDVTVYLVEKDGRPIGFQMYEALTPSLMTPDDGTELCVAGVHQAYMGRGFGKLLMNEACRKLREKGYGHILTDWRITNLASSNFWPRCGFQPVAYRMTRYIDPNYAWANISNPSVKSC